MSEERKKQVGGDHYSKLDVQPFDIFKSMGIFEQVCQANIIKYVMRYKNKNGVTDLKKAAHYLEELIKINEDVVKSEKPDNADKCSCIMHKDYKENCGSCLVVNNDVNNEGM